MQGLPGSDIRSLHIAFCQSLRLKKISKKIFDVAIGAITPDGGKIYLNGKEVHILNPVQGKELGITMIFQEFNLVP